MDNKLLGKRIKTVREEREITLDVLAYEISLNKSTLSRYERGEIATPKIPVINAIANALHVNPAWLIGKSSDRSYTPPNNSFCLFEPNNLFGPIKNLRKARNLSQDDVAFAIGISKEHYAAIENGHNTDCVTLAKLALFFCCSTDFALSFDGVVFEAENLEFVTSTLGRLHNAFSKLSANNQEKVIEYAQNLLEESDA